MTVAPYQDPIILPPPDVGGISGLQGIPSLGQPQVLYPSQMSASDLNDISRAAATADMIGTLSSAWLGGLGWGLAPGIGIQNTGFTSEGPANIRVFRAVGPTELGDIETLGTYGSNLNKSGKYFALSKQGAIDFANNPFNAARRMTITSTSFPQAIYRQGFFSMT